jgi:ribokinase
MKKPVITVIGSYVMAMTMRVNRFPTCGETLIGHSFKPVHGGKGTNQAVECARLGATVNHVICVGEDSYGDGIIGICKREGIDARHIKRSATLPSGVAFVIVNDESNNIITLDLGANMDFLPEDIAALEQVIAQSDIMLMQMEIPASTVAAAVHTAKRLGVKMILNPAPYQYLPDEIWANVDIATPNEKEAKLMAGYDPETEVDLEILGRRLLDKGIKNVIITTGEKGAFFMYREDGEEARVISGQVPARKVDAVDTTGAGDTFSAALGVAVAEGRSIVEAIRFAVAAASLSVRHYGVIDTMPYRNEVEEELKI